MKRVIAMVITLGLAFTLFAFDVYAENVAIQASYSQSWSNGDGTTIRVIATDLYGPDDAIVFDSATNYYYAHHEIMFVVVLANNTSVNRYFTQVWPGFDLSPTVQNNTVRFTSVNEITNYTDNFYLNFNDTDPYFEIVPDVNFAFSGYPCVPANSALTAICKVRLRIDFGINASNQQIQTNQAILSGVKLAGNTYNTYETNYSPIGSNDDLYLSLETIRSNLMNQGYGLPAIDDTLEDIRDLLQDIHDNMGSSDYSDTIDDSEDLQTTEETIHQQEQQWYSDNKTAIEATGLGNYQYSPGLINSFGVARYQIAMLWNALGDWTYVYYLVFLLGIAVYILKHEPTMRVKQMRADREARMQENQIYTNASRNVRMSRDADYARHVAWGFRSRRK